MSKFVEGEWLLAEQGDANEFVILSDNNRWVVSFRQNGEMPVSDQRAIGHLLAASKDMFAAIDAADTAFAVLNVQDLGGQARACIREAWPLVQSARAKARPDSGYAEAVAEAQQHEIARLDGVVAELRDALRCALNWIDAVPSESVASFPAMPGFSRDWVEDLLEGVSRDEA